MDHSTISLYRLVNLENLPPYSGVELRIRSSIRYGTRQSVRSGELFVDSTQIGFYDHKYKSRATFAIPWAEVVELSDEFKYVPAILQFFESSKSIVTVSTKVWRHPFRIFNFTHAYKEKSRSIQTGVHENLSVLLKSYFAGYCAAEARKAHLANRFVSQGELEKLTPFQFEQLVLRTFAGLGFRVSLTSSGADEGVDIRGLDVAGKKIIIQCKRYKANVSQPIVRDLYGELNHLGAFHAYLITTGSFSRPATDWAKGKPITLVDREHLFELLDQAGIKSLF